MGIKGIYGEIGPGERVSLNKLAIETLEKKGRPLRVAIDVSIWQFQTLAGQGGSNPAIRTFYYRLLRLLSFSVQPLFIFDGPHKPPFKRGKKTGRGGACVPNLLTKQMLTYFGFPFHTAPGEAEAECALLQLEGVVDAVLSEDVDTLMFGCSLTFKNWSSEGTRGNKSPTHVSVYDAKATKEGKSGLDREGMVLVALMSGGDYITEGIPRCGIKVACEAARAGFGETLCKLANNDAAGITAWREKLAHEIRTNESKFFKVKHKALTIPDNFPNREVLGYYTNPVVSTATKVQKLKEEIVWDGEINVEKLRQFTAEAFDWTNKIGATKFIRNLAPVLLVHKLRLRGNRRDSGYGDIVLTAMNEMEFVRAICGTRTHITTDGMKELRVVYSPIDIVGLNLNAEHDDSIEYSRSGLATNDNDDQDLEVSEEDTSRSPAKRGPSTYDPTQPNKMWLSETIAKIGVPLKAQDYEESLRNPKKFIRAKAVAKKALAKEKNTKGAMDKFMSVSKPSKEKEKFGISTAASRLVLPLEEDLPPVYLAPRLENLKQSLPTAKTSRATRSSTRESTESTSIKITKITTKTKSKPKTKTKPLPNTNPWTIAQASPSAKNNPKVTKDIAALLLSSPIPTFKTHSSHYISSSPPIATSPSPPPKRASPILAPTPSWTNKRLSSPIPSPAPSDVDPESDLELPDKVTISRSRSRRSPIEARDPATPSKSRNPFHPSPRKKTSPDHPTSIPSARSSQRTQMASLTPEPVARMIDFSTSIRSGENDRVNEWDREMIRDRSSSPELPSLDQLRGLRSSASTSASVSRPTTATDSSTHGMSGLRLGSTPRRLGDGLDGISSLLKSNDEKVPLIKKKQKKKYIQLRESLAGAWKEVEESDDDAFDNGNKSKKGERRVRRWRASQVQLLDMTAGP
ncbi:related to DNA repair endonuclease rad2 [Phialocephala subalpina]|uniref:Related to DNA repair endonuclease rad2 n=1 Tax=Phialocephala subalpina TaxID=576137 RepID=A0A1L7WYW7_9HELO|nr:related to DNA repair endonuclease rad2 [Phialocephala subalpina]